MGSEQKQVGWIFLAWWIGLTLVGGLVDNSESLGGVGVVLSVGVFNGLRFIISLGLVVVSLAQWILLSRYITNSTWWIITGIAGHAFGILMGKAFVQILYYSYNINDIAWLTLAYATINGIVFGAFQWAFLKQIRIRTGWWILGNGMLGPIGWMLGFTVPIIGYALRGIITGTLMLWILRQPTPERSEDSSLDTKSLPVGIGLWVILGIAYIMALTEDARAFYELYLSGSSLIGAFIGMMIGKKNGLKRAVYGWAIGIVVGFFIWFIGTCQFCQ